jgi:putative ABC transport system permease protein
VLRKLPHVAWFAGEPEVQHGGQDRDPLWDRLPSFDALKPFEFLSGGPFQGPNDVIVDDVFANSDKGYHVGDTITILNHPFRISGIVEHGKGARK